MSLEIYVLPKTCRWLFVQGQCFCSWNSVHVFVEEEDTELLPEINLNVQMLYGCHKYLTILKCFPKSVLCCCFVWITQDVIYCSIPCNGNISSCVCGKCDLISIRKNLKPTYNILYMYKCLWILWDLNNIKCMQYS